MPGQAGLFSAYGIFPLSDYIITRFKPSGKGKRLTIMPYFVVSFCNEKNNMPAATATFKELTPACIGMAAKQLARPRQKADGPVASLPKSQATDLVN